MAAPVVCQFILLLSPLTVDVLAHLQQCVTESSQFPGISSVAIYIYIYIYSDGSSCAASLGAPHCGLRWEAPPPYVHVEIHEYSFGSA